MQNQNVPPQAIATTDQHDEKDPYNITYIIHFLLGAGYLVPWNSFITAVDYFQDIYPTKHVTKCFLLQILMIGLVTGTWLNKRLEFGFVVLVLMVVVTGFAEGLTGGSLIGATGKLPDRYMQAVVAGNASAGTH
ncbi:equilibrative nucleotide transporter 8-like protein [Tanacetum coccineum]